MLINGFEEYNEIQAYFWISLEMGKISREVGETGS
jgi:hypothetical protein